MRSSAGYCGIMPIPLLDQPEESRAEEHSHSVERELSQEEIDEAKESLRRYFEVGWQIATRLQREGKLDEVLTKAGVNPTVKLSRVDTTSTEQSQTTI